MARISTDALGVATSDLSGDRIAEERCPHVAVRLDDGRTRILRVTPAEAEALAAAGEPPKRRWTRVVGWLRAHWAKGFFTLLTLFVAGILFPSAMRVWADRQAEFRAKVALARTVNESMSKLYSAANQAAAVRRPHARHVAGQKVVDGWVAAEGTIDPQVGLLFGGEAAASVRDYWRDMRRAAYDYATLSHCCARTRSADVGFLRRFVEAHPVSSPPTTRAADPWAELLCGPPTGCGGSGADYRSAYRSAGVMLVNTDRGLSRAVMSTRANGFSHWPPDWIAGE